MELTVFSSLLGFTVILSEDIVKKRKSSLLNFALNSMEHLIRTNQIDAIYIICLLSADREERKSKDRNLERRVWFEHF